MYHQLQGPPGEFPLSRGEETPLQPQVRLGACHEIRENTADRAALTQRRGGMYAYRASKGALNVSMRALAADLKPQGIIVGIVAPGMVETDLLAASGYKGPAH